MIGVVAFVWGGGCPAVEPIPYAPDGKVPASRVEAEGWYQLGFESSTFFPCGSSRDDSWWIVQSPSLDEALEGMRTAEEKEAGRFDMVVMVRFRGRRSGRGFFGHLGAASHLAVMDEVVSIRRGSAEDQATCLPWMSGR